MSAGLLFSRTNTRARRWSVGAAVAALTGCWIIGLMAAGAAAASGTLSTSTCHLAAPYQHVIYLQFDNQHLSRDNPNVPSDLQQVPALKNFLADNGALVNDEHTPLISHTADDIVTSLTGLYPDRQGLAVSNSYATWGPPGSPTGNKATGFPSAFTYWTDPVSTTDTTFNLITDGGKNTPGPWVPFTRAGCDVGGFSTADMELENTKTGPTGDITTVFGKNSPQWNFAVWSNTAFSSNNDPDNDNDAPNDQNLAVTDFEGIAIHCAQDDSVNGPSHGGVCSTQNGGMPDPLPDEPGAYDGFNALFGASAANQIVSKPGNFVASTVDDGTTANIGGNAPFADVAPAVSDVYGYDSNGCKFCANGSNKDYKGNTLVSNVIGDGNGASGFTGFDPTPAQTLGYVAAMQEAGIPVTYAYIRDAHDNWGTSTPPLVCPARGTFGPGEACYVDQLKQENQAFKAFFERLAADGINKSNTLFVITADEGDHFAGGSPTSQCDGVTTPCTYANGTVGEQDVQLAQALATDPATHDANPFAIHFDDAPNFYVQGPQGTTSPPGPLDPAVRQLEQDMGRLALTDQITGNTVPVTQHLAGAEDQTILHMTTNDPQRTPSFTVFGDPAFFYQTGGTCAAGSTPGCPVVNGGFAWNHGGDQPEVTTTWLGVVGPTVRNLGETGSVWTDHTDIRPTMLSLLGLPSDYEMDGGVVTQLMSRRSVPANVARHLNAYEGLDAVYKQLNAPVGQFGHDSEIVSTTGSESSSNSVAQGFDQQLATCQVARDALAAKMKAVLEGAFFDHSNIHPGVAKLYERQAGELIDDMRALSEMSTPPHRQLCPSSE